MIGAVILAAGYSSRMGAFKPLLEVAGIAALARVIRSLKAAGADETGVVTGHNRELISGLITQEGAAEIFNPDYSGGMFTSVLAGVKYFSDKGAAGLLLIPADYPLVPSAAVKALLSAAGGNSFAVPVYKGKKGHPLWIPSRFFSEILAHDGSMGLKGVTLRHESEMTYVEMPFEGTVLDMDEPADYEKILFFGTKDLTELSAGRRIIMLRHGETERHADRVFIGQYDVPLSAEGIKQAERAAGELSELSLNAAAVYCGSLKRARETAGILAGKLGLPVRILPGLNEMSLGAWEGRLIEDIKREYPAEYQKRGENILIYKFDGGSESFYDLQLRAVDCVKTILSEDRSRDIIVVSHSGVIKCLYGNLHGNDIGWAFTRCSPKKGEYVVVDLRRAADPGVKIL